MTSSTFETIGLSRRFRGHVAVDDISLRLDMRTLTGIVGESGSGKSTLARMLAGLMSPSSGEIRLDGIALRDLTRTRGGVRMFRRRVQFIPQDTTTTFDPLRTLRDSVTLPARTLLGLERSAARERVDSVLERLHLRRELADRRPNEVSGGQRQRFAIARALMVEPDYLICDEIVSALDVSVQSSILNMIRDYCESRQAGVLFISHGIPATAFLVDRMLVMRNGKVLEDASTDDVIDNAKSPYTIRLVDAYRSKVTS